MGPTEQQVLRLVGAMGKAGKTTIAQRLGLSPGYTDMVCQSLVREGYFKVDGRYFTIAPNGARSLMGGDLKLMVDRGVLEEVANGVAKQFIKEMKIPPTYQERAVSARKPGGQEAIKIKTSFIPLIDLKENKLESNLEGGTVEEKDRFDMSQTLDALSKIGGK